MSYISWCQQSVLYGILQLSYRHFRRKRRRGGLDLQREDMANRPPPSLFRNNARYVLSRILLPRYQIRMGSICNDISTNLPRGCCSHEGFLDSRDVLLKELRAPPFDITEGNNPYNDVADVELCIKLEGDLKDGYYVLQ